MWYTTKPQITAIHPTHPRQPRSSVSRRLATEDSTPPGPLCALLSPSRGGLGFTTLWGLRGFSRLLERLQCGLEVRRPPPVALPPVHVSIGAYSPIYTPICSASSSVSS